MSRNKNYITHLDYDNLKLQTYTISNHAFKNLVQNGLVGVTKRFIIAILTNFRCLMFRKILIAYFVKEANEKYQNEVEDIYSQARKHQI